MDVRVAMNMTHDEIKSKYKEYLRLQALSKIQCRQRPMIPFTCGRMKVKSYSGRRYYRQILRPCIAQLW